MSNRNNGAVGSLIAGLIFLGIIVAFIALFGIFLVGIAVVAGAGGLLFGAFTAIANYISSLRENILANR